jgi:hypothetical protein
MQVQIDKVVITLTTVPERLNNNHEDGFRAVVNSLCTQNNENYEVHLNLPNVYSVTGEEYVIPEWLSEIQQKYNHFKIFRTEDYGPPTKFVPTLLRESKDTLLIVVDDDLVYHNDMVNEHLKYQNMLENSAVLYDGRSLVHPKYSDLRDSWVICVCEISRVKDLQHYKSCSYFVKYFEDDFFKDFLGKTKSDDVLVSYYFKKKGIKMYVVPYLPDLDKIKTYDEWHKFQGVTTFPVLRHSHNPMKTGCNHPKLLEKEPKFYIPDEFFSINKTSFQ